MKILKALALIKAVAIYPVPCYRRRPCQRGVMLVVGPGRGYRHAHWRATYNHNAD